VKLPWAAARALVSHTRGSLPLACHAARFDVHGPPRAVDLNPDGVCTLASGWLVNGTLDASSGGAGAAHFEVQRGAPFVSGTRFDAEFRVLRTMGRNYSANASR
jgi:hypothetical protein